MRSGGYPQREAQGRGGTANAATETISAPSKQVAHVCIVGFDGSLELLGQRLMAHPSVHLLKLLTHHGRLAHLSARMLQAKSTRKLQLVQAA